MKKKDRVTEYARKVISGKVFCGNYHKLACARHLKDLERQNTSEFPYYWDIDASEKILEYAETLTIAEGNEPRDVKLIDSQIFDIGCRFGWKKQNGFRRFRRSYKSVARQNGKTFENGIMGTYIGNFSGYNYGKLFTAATKKRQAKLALEAMMAFIRADEDLKELFEIKEYKSEIICNSTNSTIEALSKEAGLDDGFRSIFSSIDEIHQHKDNKVYKALYNGTVSLDETLVSMITTRGTDISPTSFSYTMDNYAVRILEGIVTAEDFFVDIYSLDKNDDIWDEKNYIKANPYLALSEKGRQSLRDAASTAKDMGGEDLRDFKTKNLNLWSQDENNKYIDYEDWLACACDEVISDFEEQACFCGLDLSHGGDLTTLSLEFPLNNGQFYIFSHSFMPKGRLQEHILSDLAPYDVWEENNLITVTGGVNEYKNDYKFIISFLKEIISKYKLKVKTIGYDPHNADGFLSDLEELGIPLLEITQSAKFLNDATVDMQLNIKSKNVKYDRKNELLSWSVSNAKTVSNSFGEIKIDKEPRKLNKRIDPVDATINAHVAYMKFQEDINVDNELEKYLQVMSWKNEESEE
jgi:phage terminase large subunit-like protein